MHDSLYWCCVCVSVRVFVCPENDEKKTNDSVKNYKYKTYLLFAWWLCVTEPNVSMCGSLFGCCLCVFVCHFEQEKTNDSVKNWKKRNKIRICRRNFKYQHTKFITNLNLFYQLNDWCGQYFHINNAFRKINAILSITIENAPAIFIMQRINDHFTALSDLNSCLCHFSFNLVKIRQILFFIFFTFNWRLTFNSNISNKTETTVSFV